MMESGRPARDYQVEIAKKALKQNSIVCLGTGTGKTFISGIVIKELQDGITGDHASNGKRTFFIVSTVPLVKQQATEIRTVSSLNVGEYTGDMNVDFWKKEDWIREFDKNDVLVMTAQILVNILGSGFIGLHNINLLVFDECHNASKNHPYVNILEFHEKCPEKDHPHILGLTASIINKKCKKKQKQDVALFIARELRRVEATMRSVCITCSNPLATALYATRPKEVIKSYSNVVCDNGFEDVVEKFKALKVELEHARDFYRPNDQPARNTSEQINYSEIYDLVMEWTNDRKAAEVDDCAHCAAKYCLQVLVDLGPFCAYEVAKILLDRIGSYGKFLMDSYSKKVFKDIGALLQKVMTTFETCIANTPFQYVDRIIPMEPLITNKALTLLSDVLYEEQQKFKNEIDADMCAILFVEKRCTAVFLSGLINYNSKSYPGMFGDLKSEYVLGHNAGAHLRLSEELMISSRQNKILADFKMNKFNVLVATSIVEEGLDVQKCNLVVRFDSIGNFRQYAQSKGRARSKDSKFIVMAPLCEKAEVKFELEIMQELEKTLLTKCREDNLTPLTEDEIKEAVFDKNKVYIPTYYIDDGPNSASITRNSCIPLLSRYCNKLPSDEYCSNNPVFTYEAKPSMFRPLEVRATVLLPVTVPLDEKIYTGEWMPYDTKKKKTRRKSALEKKGHLARKSVCMLVCKKLYTEGHLDHHLLSSYFESDDEMDSESEMDVSNEGENEEENLKEHSYLRKVPDMFSSHMSGEKRFYLYAISISLLEAKHSGLQTLWRSEKMSFGVLLPCLVPSILPDVMLYTQVGILSVRLEYVYSLDTLPESALSYHKYVMELCALKYVYGNVNFNWNAKAVSKAILIPLANRFQDMRRNKAIKMAEVINVDSLNSFHQSNTESDAIGEKSVIQKTYLQKDRIYYVTKCLHETAGHIMDGGKTYAEYYDKKYGLTVNPSTHLLQVMPISTRVSFTSNVGSRKSEDKLGREEKLVPDLCKKVVSFDANSHQQMILVPYIFFAFESLLNAYELRTKIADAINISCEDKKSDTSAMDVDDNLSLKEAIRQSAEITCETNSPSIHDILKSITTKQSSFGFNLERLEMLGDSFLKLAITIHVYFKYPADHEGNLTEKRKKYIGNKNLFDIAKDVGIQKIICNSHFGTVNNERRNCNTVWLPPGYERVVEKDDVGNKIGPYQTVSKKCLADCIEALIGLYLNSGGINLALKFMQDFLKLDVMFSKIPKEVRDTVKSPYLSFYADYHIANTAVTSHSSYEDVKKMYHGMKFSRLEKKIGYKFRNKSYLVQAMKHLSHNVSNVTDCYQRLEFLGDAVLDFLITFYVFINKKDVDPGQLTFIRSALVNNNVLALLVVKYGFDTHIMHLAPQFNSELKEFKSATGFNGESFDYELLDSCFESPFVIIPKNSDEGYLAPKLLGDIFESIVGAVFLDCHMNLLDVWKVIYPLMENIIDKYMQKIPQHPVGEFMEKYCDGELKFDEDGICTATFDGGRTVCAYGKNHKIAKVTAAWKALNQP